CLLILDNWETVLEPGAPAGAYRAQYGDYGRLLQMLAGSEHPSCLLLTSREAPEELRPVSGARATVRGLALGGLGGGEGRALLAEKGLTGDAAAWTSLSTRYGGNPLALRVVGEAIQQVFGGDIGAFLAYVAGEFGAVFGGIRRLLDEQGARPPPSGPAGGRRVA